MLVISRKASDQFIIGEGENKTVITILSVKGDRVRLGVEADENVRVVRGELEKGKAA